MDQTVKVVIDAMGGDHAPFEIVKGAVEAIKKYEIKVILVGRSLEIENELSKYTYDKSKIEIVHADEVILNEEQPTVAIRKKKNSSMVVGMNLLKEKRANAFISAGSTGGILTGGLFILGRIKGIDRPALAPLVPHKKGVFLLIDGGSNVDCKPINLMQFGQMGSVYMKNVLKFSLPRVGLLNIGTELEKGNKLTKDAYEELEKAKIHFVGNVEAREVPNGICDVLVCDGFVGNVLLKYTEGFALSLFSTIKKEFTANLSSKIGALILKPALQRLRGSFDYEEYGGAPLLGVNGVVIKIHGSSKASSVMYAVKQAKEFVDTKVVEKISEEIINKLDTSASIDKNIKV